jgi:hypothetical protein
MVPDYTADGLGIFSDDFETGGHSMWSRIVR